MSPFRVIITQPIGRQLQEIHRRIARDSPDNAAAVLRELFAAIDSLSSMPDRATVAGKSRSRVSTIHRLPVGMYLIYYRVDVAPSEVLVVEVRHGARRQPRRFE